MADEHKDMDVAEERRWHKSAVNDPFEEDIRPQSQKRQELLLNLDGFEGPIDLLLNLSRDQKVDLAKISILQLANQYLAFIEEARNMRLEIAADYLVMAAWLAYLKSRILLPQEEVEEGELSGPEMAEALAFQLRRLESMQDSARRLFERPRLGVDIFGRGMPEGLPVETSIYHDVSLYELLTAYGDINRRREYSEYSLQDYNLVPLDEALARLSRMLGKLPRKGKYSAWATLDAFLPEDLIDSLMRRSAMASTLIAGLELAKQGKLDIRQDEKFKPIYVRANLDVNEHREDA